MLCIYDRFLRGGYFFVHKVQYLSINCNSNDLMKCLYFYTIKVEKFSLNIWRFSVKNHAKNIKTPVTRRMYGKRNRCNEKITISACFLIAFCVLERYGDFCDTRNNL